MPDMHLTYAFGSRWLDEPFADIVWIVGSARCDSRYKNAFFYCRLPPVAVDKLLLVISTLNYKGAVPASIVPRETSRTRWNHHFGWLSAVSLVACVGSLTQLRRAVRLSLRPHPRTTGTTTSPTPLPSWQLRLRDSAQTLHADPDINNASGSFKDAFRVWLKQRVPVR